VTNKVLIFYMAL